MEERHYLNEGYTLKSNGNFLNAINYYTRIFENHPDYSLILFDLGNCYLNINQYHKALKCYDSLDNTLFDNNEMIFIKKSRCYLELEEYDEAINLLDKAIDINPNNEEAWIIKGIYFNKINNFDDAIYCFDKSIDIRHNSDVKIEDSPLEDIINTYFKDYSEEEVWFNKGFSYYSLYLFNDALSSFDEVLSINSLNYGAWGNKGLCHYVLGNENTAIECFDKAIELNPNDDEVAWKYKGLCFLRLKEYYKAIDCFNETIRINPLCEESWLSKGTIYLQLNQLDEAFRCADKVAEINPNNEGLKAFKNIKSLQESQKKVEYYFKNGQIEKGMGTFIKSLEEDMGGYSKIGENDNYYSEAPKTKEESLKKVNNNLNSSKVESDPNFYKTEIQKEFEKLNTTTKNIFDLGDLEVLIILNDGTNLTNWADVNDKDDILYISEDLSNKSELQSKYADLKYVKCIIAYGVSNKVKSLKKMFKNCWYLQEIKGFDTWDVSRVNTMEDMFKNCRSLSKVSGLESWNVANVENMKYMFYNCKSLSNISDLKDWDILNLSEVYSMFYHCTSLIDSTPIDNWEIYYLSKKEYVFKGCTSLYDDLKIDDFKLNVETGIREKYHISFLFTPIKNYDYFKIYARLYDADDVFLDQKLLYYKENIPKNQKIKINDYVYLENLKASKIELYFLDKNISDIRESMFEKTIII